MSRTCCIVWRPASFGSGFSRPAPSSSNRRVRVPIRLTLLGLTLSSSSLTHERKRARGQPLARAGELARMLHQSTRFRVGVSIVATAILLGCGSDSNKGTSSATAATGGSTTSGSGIGGTNATGGLSSAGGVTGTGGTTGIISTLITTCFGAVVGSVCSTAGPCDSGSALPCLCDGSTIVACFDPDAGIPDFDGGIPDFDGGMFPNF